MTHPTVIAQHLPKIHSIAEHKASSHLSRAKASELLD
jgi:hypothetical protein